MTISSPKSNDLGKPTSARYMNIVDSTPLKELTKNRPSWSMLNALAKGKSLPDDGPNLTEDRIKRSSDKNENETRTGSVAAKYKLFVVSKNRIFVCCMFDFVGYVKLLVVC